jgi:hypothetical protein
MFHIHIRLIPIPQIALIALIALVTSIGINLLFMPSIVARTEKRTFKKLNQANTSDKMAATKLSKSAKMDIINAVYKTPIGVTINQFMPDLYDELQENPDKFESYLRAIEQYRQIPLVKEWISKLMNLKKPDSVPYQDIEGMR